MAEFIPTDFVANGVLIRRCYARVGDRSGQLDTARPEERLFVSSCRVNRVLAADIRAASLLHDTNVSINTEHWKSKTSDITSLFLPEVVTMLLLNTLVGLATLATCFHLPGLEKRQSSEVGSRDWPIIPSFNVSLPVDHFNESDTRTYDNRYWVNDTYYQSGGPVFFYHFGQTGVSDQQAANILAELHRPTALMSLARQYNGMAILFEHRYYGLSNPIPFDTDSALITPGVEPVDAPEGWSYLTIEQALEDVVYFANNLESGGYQTGNFSALAPSNTPWIWVGGTYGASLGAVARISESGLNGYSAPLHTDKSLCRES